MTLPSGPDSALPVREGDVLAGKYRVERVLGVGGMGVVVAAHHIMLDEKVALKFLLPDAGVNADSVARFIREARAATKIKNEHVARVTDVGVLENGSPYMVMEHLDGTDLAGWVSQRGALAIDQAVDFVLQACEAIAEAHSLGIVHRDLKPANLFCVQKPDGTLSVKVLDFGISKITTAGAPGHHLTKTSTFLGSPLYMSPEQMKASKNVDARSDIWSLGVILYELLAGRPPFNADVVTELAIMVANETPPGVRTLRPDTPTGLDRVIARCLEKDTALRFQNVGELALALQPFGTARARISVDGIVGTLRNTGGRAPAVSLPQVGVPPVSPPQAGVPPVLPPQAGVPPVSPPQAPPAALRGMQTPTETTRELPLQLPVTAQSAPQPDLGATTSRAVASERFPAPATPRKSRRTVIAIAVPLVAAVGLLATAALWKATAVPVTTLPPAPIDSSVAPSTSAASQETPPIAPVSTPPPSGVVAVTSSPPPLASPTPASPPSAAPVAVTPVRPAPSAPAARPAAPSCSPPTWTDARGIVHMKPGCR